MKRILEKLVKLYGHSHNLIDVEYRYKYYRHINEFKLIYKVYMSDYIYKDGTTYHTPEFNTLKELEQYLKENVTNYK